MTIIEIPKKYKHKIESVKEDKLYKFHKNVILSTYFKNENEDINDIKSLYYSCKSLDLHLIIFHNFLSNDFIQKYATNKILFKKTQLIPSILINNQKFLIYYEYLSKNPYENILSTDISTKILKDPFELINKFYLRPNIDQELVNLIIKNNNFKELLKYSPLKPEINDYNNLTNNEIKRYLTGLKELDKNKFEIKKLLFIGTKDINEEPSIINKFWFENNKNSIDILNEALNKSKKYKEYKLNEFQLYNSELIMANYETYIKFTKKYIKILLECIKISDKKNFYDIIPNYICHNFFSENYNKNTYQSKNIYTGYPFNSLYNKFENLDKSECYILYR